MHANSIAGIAALTLAAAASTALGAQPVVVDAEPLAQRVVTINMAALRDNHGRAGIKQQIRAAAKAVCDRQYPREPEFQFIRACYAGSFQEAWSTLTKVREGQVAEAGQLKIAVRSR